MYSRQETARIKQSFWTSFGQYMKPVPAAGGEKNSWVNYKTGIRHIYFRMTAEKDHASIAIELANPSQQIREIQYSQVMQFKTMLHKLSSDEWSWNMNAFDSNGMPISRISQSLSGVNVLKESDWPAIISFLKPRIVILDRFWEEIKYGFE
ncbi:MAG: DUF4268 domain-containing protein [Sediminibacterium sp.]